MVRFVLNTIEDPLTTEPEPIGSLPFWGYYNNWVSPIFHDDSTLEIPCIQFDLEEGGLHETFGGYFVNKDSLYFGYSSGGLGAGSYKEISGKKH
ncbi:MAG: hypothetical protein KAT68_02640 [Bacteroidales bacterium]|nr:hypothetical protein [Bacteroidales bacterium]